MTFYHFPISDYWWFYSAFILLVLALLAIDLGVFHRKAHRVSVGEAACWSSVWIALALAFNYFLYRYALWQFQHDLRLTAIPGFDPSAAARQVGLEFLIGYVVEKSLSADNIFVFVVVFRYFRIPAEYQHRVLFFGIIGALIFRAIFISLGAVLMQFHWVIWILGGVLILTGVKMMFVPEREIEPDKNPLIRLLHRCIAVTPEMHGQRFFVRVNDTLYATPLFVALLFLEVTDVLFAVDSVPAIFALTREPLIVFTSNIFAMLGLRALYFLLAGAVERFYLLKFGLAIVLVFVGLKMVWLNDLYGGKFPIGISLAFISVIIAVSIVLSLVITRGQSEKERNAPSNVHPPEAL